MTQIISSVYINIRINKVENTINVDIFSRAPSFYTYQSCSIQIRVRAENIAIYVKGNLILRLILLSVSVRRRIQ